MDFIFVQVRSLSNLDSVLIRQEMPTAGIAMLTVEDLSRLDCALPRMMLCMSPDSRIFQ